VVAGSEAKLAIRASDAELGLAERADSSSEQLRRGLDAAQRLLASRAEVSQRAMAERAQSAEDSIAELAEGAARTATEQATVGERRISDATMAARGALEDAAEEIRLRAERTGEATERGLRELARSHERESGARLRADLGSMVLEARGELIALRDDLIRIGGDLRNASGVAEERIAQTARIAEATVSTRAQSAAAEAIRDLTAAANDLSQRIARQASTLEGRERLDEVLARLRAADERLRRSDERTRRALGHLKAVPDETDDDNGEGQASG